MDKIIIFCVTILIYLISFIIVYKSIGNLFSIPTLILGVWGFVLIGGLEYYILNSHILLPIIVALSALSFSFGVKYSAISFKFNPKRVLHNPKFHQVFLETGNFITLKLAIGTSMILILFIFTSKFLPVSPILNPSVLRIEVVQPGMGPFFRLIKVGLPLLSIMYFLIAVKRKRKAEWLVTILMFVITSICLMLFGYKGYVLWFIVLALITFGYLEPRSRRLIIISIILLIVGILTSLFVLYFTNSAARSGSFNTMIQLLWRRVTYEQTLGLDYVVYSLVPRYGFYYGETMVWDFTWTVSDLSQGVFFSHPHQSLTGYIPTLILGYESLYGATTMVIGDFYANWGLLGTIMGCFLYGWLSGILYIIILLRSKKGLILFPFWANLSWIFVQMASTGAPIAFFLSEFFSLFLFYVFFALVYVYFYFLSMSVKKTKFNYEHG